MSRRLADEGERAQNAMEGSEWTGEGLLSLPNKRTLQFEVKQNSLNVLILSNELEEESEMNETI